jgi:V8-like Glu-specific endopeptidase
MLFTMFPRFTSALAACTLSLLASSVNAALIPPFFMDSVATLGGEQPVPTQRIIEPQQMNWVTEGTGFFYGELIKDDPDPLKQEFQVYLVTAKHVVVGHNKTFHNDLSVRLNGKDPSKVQQFRLENSKWFFHPNENIDIAIVPIDLNYLRSEGFFPNVFTKGSVANLDKLKELGVAAGDGIFVLGFPMDLAGKQRNYVIVRNGIIARLDETLDHASDKFMIDSFVFPGNSGGPVVLKPDAISINGTKAQSTAYLIGVVIDYQTYNDVAISPQTGRSRASFEENSGLAEVLPTDYIDETITALRVKTKAAGGH